MKKGIIFLTLATIFWGGNYICGRFLADALPATLLNTVRWAISTIILFGILFINKKKISLLLNWKQFLITGFFGIFAFSTLNYLGLKFISASTAGMISAGSPIAILLFTPIILKEKIPLQAWIGTIISVIGVIILFQGKSSADAHSSFLGSLLMVLACLSWGLYTVFGKKFGKHIDSLTMTAGASFYGTLLSSLSCIGTVHTGMIDMSLMTWLAVLYVSTLASVAAFLLWNMGVGILGAGQAAPYINLLPVWTVLLGMTILNEHLAAVTFIGGIITIGGAVLASIPNGFLRKKINMAKSRELNS